MKQKAFSYINTNHFIFALLWSIGITFFTFSIYVAQYISSDVITFLKDGDQLQNSYPFFVQAKEYFFQGIISGMDVNTFNGATDFFSRILYSFDIRMIWTYFLTTIIPLRGAYMMYFAIGLALTLYYGQRVGYRFFNINKWLSLLMSVAFMRIVLVQMWFTGYFGVAVMVFPMLYYSLLSLEENRKIFYILAPIFWVSCFMGAGMVHGVYLVIIVYLFSVMYALLYKESTLKNAIFKSALLPGIATIICLLKYLEVFIYLKTIVKLSPYRSSLNYASAIGYNVTDLLVYISDTFVPVARIEKWDLPALGFFWVFVIYLCFKENVIAKMQRKEVMVVYFGIFINVLILFVSLGINTPFAAWFYMLPLAGKMHLPLRFFMITMPFLYLALVMMLSHCKSFQNEQEIKRIGKSLLTILFILLVINRIKPVTFIFLDKFTIDIILISIIIYSVYKKGIHEKTTVILSVFVLIYTSLAVFYLYSAGELYAHKDSINGRSIVFQEETIERIDEFIDMLPEKERYKYLSYNSFEGVPTIVPPNYPLWNLNKHKLTHYTGYDLHSGLPEDFRDIVLWFNNVDLDYFNNTRADFIIVDDPVLAANESLAKMIDHSVQPMPLYRGMSIYKLYKYIPNYYVNEKHTIDSESSFDNGYFYSMDISNEDVLSFSTDDSKYFSINVEYDQDYRISFLLYPSQYYKYYIDGIEINPKEQDDMVHFNVSSGNHTIEIKYENKLGMFGSSVIYLYYIIWTVLGLFIFIKKRLANQKLYKL